MWLYLYHFHFFVRDLNLDGVSSFIQLRFDLKSSACDRLSNQLYNHLMADQGSTPPVHTDMRKETMLDLVPFAGSRREVAYGDPQTHLGSQVLQLNFPQADAVSVTSPTIGTNQQVRGAGVDLPAHPKPPASNTGSREARRIMVRTDVDPAHVLTDIIHSIRDNLGRFGRSKIMNLHVFRLSFRLPFLATILEISHQLFLLGVHRNDRLVAFQKFLHPAIDILKLSVSIRMTCPLKSLRIRLQTVIQSMQQIRHRHVADGIPFPPKLLRQLPRAFAGPPQGRPRITPGYRINQRFQFLKNLRMIFRYVLSAASRLTNPSGDNFLALNFSKGLMNRNARYTRCFGNLGNATPTQRPCFGSYKQSALLLVQVG